MADDPSEETIHGSSEKRSRRGIASFFRRVARRLSRGEPVPVDDEQTVTVDPPAESDLEVELEREGDQLSLEIEMEWEEGDEDVVADAAASKATFEVYEDQAGEYRWRLVHRNGNIIADGGEGYASRQKAKQGLESVKGNVAGAPLVDETRDGGDEPAEGGSDATVELFEDAEGKYRWRLVHDNGNLIADSGQGYSSKQKAKQGLTSVRTNAPGAPVES